MRIEYQRVAREATRALYGVSEAVQTSSLDAGVRELVSVLVSQRNHCAHCIATHWEKSLAVGVSEKQLRLVGAWREAEGSGGDAGVSGREARTDERAAGAAEGEARTDERAAGVTGRAASSSTTGALYSTRERAALALADQLTEAPEQGVPDELWAAAAAAFSEDALIHLVFQIMLMNAWNRMSIALRLEV